MIKSFCRFYIRKARFSKEASKPLATQTVKTPSKEEKTESTPEKTQIDYNGLFNFAEYIQRGGKVEDIVDMEYKNFPSEIEHWNPSSPKYIQSDQDEADIQRSINSHNAIIDQFKRDLKLQREYQAAIQKMDRPYLKGTPGIDKSVFDAPRDYSESVNHKDKSIASANSDALDLTLNENWPLNFANYGNKFTKTSNLMELEEESRNAKVTDEFHHDKGSKFDVVRALEEKYPHVADRLGHPEIFPTPLETLLRLERPLAHPGYLDQPFVRIPSAEPDKSVDFSAGEVIYSNSNALEWGRFWSANYVGVLVAIAFYFPYINFGLNSTPTFRVRDEYPAPYFDQSWYSYDYYQLFPVVFGAVSFIYLITGLVS